MGRGRIWLSLGCIFAALYAAGLVYEIDFAPAGCCGLTWPTPDPFAAERILAQTDPKGRDGRLQRQTAVQVLAARPMDAQEWLRLAYADRLTHGQLTDAGARDVEMSYLVEPYAGPQVYWRLGFDLDNWSRLTPQTRTDAMAEMKVALHDSPSLYITAPRGDDSLGALANRAADPSGRMAAALMGLK